MNHSSHSIFARTATKIATIVVFHLPNATTTESSINNCGCHHRQPNHPRHKTQLVISPISVTTKINHGHYSFKPLVPEHSISLSLSLTLFLDFSSSHVPSSSCASSSINGHGHGDLVGNWEY